MSAPTGTLTPIGITRARKFPTGIAFTKGTNPIKHAPTSAVTANQEVPFKSVGVFTIDGLTGALTQVGGSPFPVTGMPSAVAVDPSGKFVHVASQISNTLSVYSMNSASGALSPLQTSPYGTSSFPSSVAIDPSGRFVYVANSSASTITAFTRNEDSGILAQIAGSPYATGGAAQ